MARVALVLASLVALGAGCTPIRPLETADGSARPDAFTTPVDAFTPQADAFAPPDDASTAGLDAASPDTAVPLLDAGRDTGPALDGGQDGGAPDTCVGLEACNGLDDDCNGLVDDGDPCPGCMTFTNAGRTYQLCATTRTWTAARAACMTMGYDLAIIENATEQSFVAPLATRGGFGGAGTGVWIGLAGDPSGTFTWVNGTAPTYTAWATGEPNLPSSCVRLRSVVSGQWADTDCTASNGYLCELP